MKICVVFDKVIYGGIERVGISDVRFLVEAGHTVEVYILDPNTEAIVNELAAICPVHVVPLRRSFCPEYYFALLKRWEWGKFVFPLAYAAAWLFLKLQWLWKRQPGQYDIAIAFSGHYNDLNFVARNFVQAKHKVAWLHGAYYEYALMGLGYVELYRKIHNLVALSHECDEEMSEYFPQEPFHIEKILNPVVNDLTLLDTAKIDRLQAEHGEFLLMVARFLPPKDFVTVIEAIELLLLDGFAAPKVVFLGDGPTFEPMRQLVAKKHLESQFVFEGTRADVVNYYRACYALVHSTLLEGLGIVLVEALLEGKPVVATDSKVGIAEVLGNNAYGLLCKVQDPRDMAEQIKRIYTDKALYTHYASLAKTRAADFSPETIRIQLLTYLDRIAASEAQNR